MGVRFNRNDSNVRDDKFYLEDYRDDLNWLEEQIRSRIADFETLPVIIQGLELSMDSDGNVQISPGIAYDGQANRIVVPTVQAITPSNKSGGNNYVILRYRIQEGVRKAFYTGVEYPAKLHDSFEIVVSDTFQQNDVVLGNVVFVNGNWEITYSERTPYVSRPAPKDTFPPSPPIITQIETNPMHDNFLELLGIAPNSYVQVSFEEVSDSSGIRGYEVVWVPYILDENTQSLVPIEIEKKTVFATSSPVRISPIPTGQKGKVLIRAIDNAGNTSIWRESKLIRAGGKEITLPAPAVIITPQLASVQIEIQEVKGADGYEVYVGIGNQPPITQDYLFYRGKLKVHTIPVPKNQTVFVSVRAYNMSMSFSDTTTVQGKGIYDSSYLDVPLK